jgi:NAD-dependent dihydropyrimidine dehydrogenase PreA subunit
LPAPIPARLRLKEEPVPPNANPLFIRVEIDPDVAKDKELANKLVEVCPVNIFATDGDGNAVIVEENEDECVLCELCIQAAPPGAVIVTKLYDGTVLKR